MNLTEMTTFEDSQETYISDLVLPSVIIGLLFFLNAFILAAIYVYKKRLLVNGADPWQNNVPLKQRSRD